MSACEGIPDVVLIRHNLFKTDDWYVAFTLSAIAKADISLEDLPNKKNLNKEEAQFPTNVNAIVTAQSRVQLMTSDCLLKSENR